MNLDDIREFFDENDNFLLTTHESPDGDGLGAEYALCAALQDIGKDVFILNSDAHAAKYDFFDSRGLIHNYSEEKNIPRIWLNATW